VFSVEQFQMSKLCEPKSGQFNRRSIITAILRYRNHTASDFAESTCRTFNRSCAAGAVRGSGVSASPSFSDVGIMAVPTASEKR
jgi:hypothetical protein